MVHVLQVAAERKRKATTKPLSLADSAVAELEPGLPAAQGPSATDDGSVIGASSSAAERGQQEHARTGKVNGITPEQSQNSSSRNSVEKRLDDTGADTVEQIDVEKTQSVPPDVQSHNKADEAKKDNSCNGFHDSANETSSQQDDANPAKSMDPQQLAKGTKEAAASQAAAQERQQRLVQSLIEGCDELADDHQQVGTSSGAQQQAIRALPNPLFTFDDCRLFFEILRQELPSCCDMTTG